MYKYNTQHTHKLTFDILSAMAASHCNASGLKRFDMMLIMRFTELLTYYGMEKDIDA